MQILINVPPNLPGAIQCTPEQFAREAKIAMAVKLFEMKRLSSGMVATLADMERVSFLAELQRYNVAMIDLNTNELHSDINNA
ncbi:UPF0175 family protein [Methylicorpusculum oleiharenae]|uniref:UPF0175 family protein n=1 Tax=Methylicorpusculum oleiharenae TaxID=1338687 RepID=UPI0013586048|nr:UPF0175 family protein [Methylicorpusculum oleiharenae]MCD2452752.1 UPF0175 family protein [Methylicorpusculum oleiharenae]